ncbi:MAG: DUF3857 domain-containing protein [Bacteroidota bacterium]
MQKQLLCCLLCFLTFYGLYAQQISVEEVKYGKVPHSLVRKAVTDSFPEANAVVVHDFGSVNFVTFGKLPKLRYYYHKRIKIQNDAGRSQANVEIVYSGGGLDESLTELKAATYNLNGEGEVVRFDVSKRMMKKEKLANGKRKISFSLPFVKPGSVIEYSYAIFTKEHLKLRPWAFQDTLPVLRSEFQTWIPMAYRYRTVYTGDVSGLQLLSDQYRTAPRINRSYDQPANLVNDNFMQNRLLAFLSGVTDVYVMENVPALVEESFSPENSDFIPGIELQLGNSRRSQYQNPNVFDNWSALSKKMTRKLKLRRPKVDQDELTQMVARANRRGETSVDVARYIFETVRKRFRWNEEYTYALSDPKKLLEGKSKSSADINTALILLFREAGFQADPVLISTRDHGRIQTIFPSLEQFNHLIVALDVAGKEYLLDATSDLDDWKLLPKNDLNLLGWRVTDQGGRWVKISSQGRLTRTTYTRFALQEDGTLNGEVSVISKGYRARLERQRLARYEQGANTYLEKHVLPTVARESIAAANVLNSENPEKPLVIGCQLTTRDFVRAAGDILILDPIMTYPVEQNPFPEEDRMTPVDLAFPLHESYMLGLIIPENYEVAQLPQPIRVLLPNGAGNFTFNVFQDENILFLTSTLFIEQTVYLPQEYRGVREFFEYVTTKHDEDIVLRKIKK